MGTSSSGASSDGPAGDSWSEPDDDALDAMVLGAPSANVTPPLPRAMGTPPRSEEMRAELGTRLAGTLEVIAQDVKVQVDFDPAAVRGYRFDGYPAGVHVGLPGPFLTLIVSLDGPTVVVTHFAPSLRSADPRYGLTPGTAGFCNALDDLLDRADFWLHGHLHCPSDYVDGGPRHCRVLANPLGYAGKGEQEAFLPRCLIDV